MSTGGTHVAVLGAGFHDAYTLRCRFENASSTVRVQDVQPWSGPQLGSTVVSVRAAHCPACYSAASASRQRWARGAGAHRGCAASRRRAR